MRVQIEFIHFIDILGSIIILLLHTHCGLAKSVTVDGIASQEIAKLEE